MPEYKSVQNVKVKYEVEKKPPKPTLACSSSFKSLYPEKQLEGMFNPYPIYEASNCDLKYYFEEYGATKYDANPTNVNLKPNNPWGLYGKMSQDNMPNHDKMWNSKSHERFNLTKPLRSLYKEQNKTKNPLVNSHSTNNLADSTQTKVIPEEEHHTADRKKDSLNHTKFSKVASTKKLGLLGKSSKLNNCVVQSNSLNQVLEAKKRYKTELAHYKYGLNYASMINTNLTQNNANKHLFTPAEPIQILQPKMAEYSPPKKEKHEPSYKNPKPLGSPYELPKSLQKCYSEVFAVKPKAFQQSHNPAMNGDDADYGNGSGERYPEETEENRNRVHPQVLDEYNVGVESKYRPSFNVQATHLKPNKFGNSSKKVQSQTNTEEQSRYPDVNRTEYHRLLHNASPHNNKSQHHLAHNFNTASRTPQGELNPQHLSNNYHERSNSNSVSPLKQKRPFTSPTIPAKEKFVPSKKQPSRLPTPINEALYSNLNRSKSHKNFEKEFNKDITAIGNQFYYDNLKLNMQADLKDMRTHIQRNTQDFTQHSALEQKKLREKLSSKKLLSPSNVNIGAHSLYTTNNYGFWANEVINSNFMEGKQPPIRTYEKKLPQLVSKEIFDDSINSVKKGEIESISKNLLERKTK